MEATMKGLLGPGQLHARVEEIKRVKGTPPWTEKVVVNDQIVGTLICQPPGHPNDRHYHLADEWWVVLEGEIDWRAVHSALAEIGYKGTATVELSPGNAEYLKEVNHRFDRILNGV